MADSPAAPAVPEASDAGFDIVTRANGTVKVKGNFSEEGTERLINTATVGTERLIAAGATANERQIAAGATANERLTVTAAIAATPFILGGLGGLAIWKMAGRRVPKTPTTVYYPFFIYT